MDTDGSGGSTLACVPAPNVVGNSIAIGNEGNADDLSRNISSATHAAVTNSAARAASFQVQTAEDDRSFTTKECDEQSCISTGISKSRKTTRRESQRQKKAMVAAGTFEKVDMAIQCDILKGDSKEKLADLKVELNRAHLKLLAARGEIARLRREAGNVHDEWQFSDDECGGLRGAGDSSEDEKESDIDRSNVGGIGRSQTCSKSSNPSSSDSSLCNEVEVGDIAEIIDLESETGRAMNGFYARVVSFDSGKQRYGIQLKDGRSALVRPANLRMGMKLDELSSDDEKILLDLQPMPQDIRELPFRERVKAIHPEDTATPV